jgi:hypothetical protein
MDGFKRHLTTICSGEFFELIFKKYQKSKNPATLVAGFSTLVAWQ